MDLLKAVVDECPGARAREADESDVFDGAQPEIVVCPTEPRDVAVIVKLAALHGRTVVAKGRGTKLDWGNPPSSAQVVIDVSRMDGVAEHASGDLVVRVQAGMPLAALNQQLASSRQWLPIDDVVPGSTIGGVVATGLSGPSRYLHGAVRDLLIGVSIVRADGVAARAGSKVVKNVAGYDLAKLFTGSYGTLGIITEAIFRLRPTPVQRRYVTADFADEDAMAPTLAGLLRAQTAIAAIEISRPEPAGPVQLGVLLEGRPGPVDDRARATSALLGAARVSNDPPDRWGALPGPVTVKVTSELASVAALLRLVSRLSEKHQLTPEVRGSAGAGVIYVGLPTDVPLDAIVGFVTDVRSESQSFGGSTTVLRAPAEVRNVLDVWGPVPGLALMRQVKKQFDPERRLAPGRFVGGI